jgi:hypothetical protein
MQAIQDIFQIWPSVTVMAREVGAPFDRARKWLHCGRIPVDVWPAVIAAAEKRGRKLTADELLAATKPRPKGGKLRVKRAQRLS